ncbi:kinase-like domain-containing protein [Mycena polygramma]|nr:kinase-like domain-containing protein [Mycena polygramma]
MDAQMILDLLQDLLDIDSFSVIKPLLLKALIRLSRTSGVHPRCFPLYGLQKVGKQVTGGGFGDIWKGLIHGRSVSVKMMRVFDTSDVQTILKDFGREAVIWRQLCHPGILPFFGLYYLEDRLCLVSPWMEKGNVMQFIARENPSCDSRLSLILDIALGLQYLHKKQVIHGDLKGLNILVTPSDRACIADFGVSSIAASMSARFTHSTATSRAGTARYQAPELFRGKSPSQNHFGSDVYAFACVCYEIMTGKVPFYELANDMAVMFRVSEGEHPSRSMSFTGTTVLDSLWTLLLHCWDHKPAMRPKAANVVKRLIDPSIGATSPNSMADWDDEFTSRFRRSLHQPLLPSVNEIDYFLFDDGGEDEEVNENEDNRGHAVSIIPSAGQLVTVQPSLGSPGRQPKRRYDEISELDEESHSNIAGGVKKSRATSE